MDRSSARSTYTHGHQEAVLRSHRWRTVDNSAAYLRPHLGPGLTVLDVGCGPGTLTTDLARHVDPGRVVGIDLAAPVVTEAATSAADAGVNNVSFVSGDFMTAGFEPSRFDIVHAHQVLQHVTEPVGALARMGELAQPGGLVAARDSDYSAMTWAPASAALDRWLEIYLTVTRRNGAEANAGRWLLAWAHRAGFEQVTYTTSTWTFATTDTRAWWADLWAERTVASSFAEQAVAYGISDPDELREVAAGWKEWATDRDSVFTVPHGEVVARTPA